MTMCTEHQNVSGLEQPWSRAKRIPLQPWIDDYVSYEQKGCKRWVRYHWICFQRTHQSLPASMPVTRTLVDMEITMAAIPQAGCFVPRAPTRIVKIWFSSTEDGGRATIHWWSCTRNVANARWLENKGIKALGVNSYQRESISWPREGL